MAEGGDRRSKSKSKSRSPPPRSPTPTSPAKASLQKGQVQIVVSLLDSTEITLDVERKVKAADVIERVHTDVDTGEKDYFSLFVIIDNHKIFLDPLKTVRDQLEDKQSPWRLHYGVKFYIPDPAKLKQDYSRYLYCLQLCKDIKENKVFTDRETATRLSALMLQASVGDYDPDTHKDGYTQDFGDFMLLPRSVQPENYEAQLVELHKAKAGYTPAQAEAEFLELARKLPRYGTHLFAAQDEHHTLIQIGNSFRGVSIYREQTEVMQFPWANVVKISYRRRKFRVKYRPTADTTDRRAVAFIKFACGEPPAAKRVWKNAVEQHTFFRLVEPEQPSRLQTMFTRGSKFRYSGRTFRQAQGSKVEKQEPNFTRSHSERPHKKPYKDYAPGYVPSVEHYVIGKPEEQDPKWLILQHPPPHGEAVDKTKTEQQKVQVDFRVLDGLPEEETHKFVIRKNGGGYDIQSASPGKKEEPSYRLSVIDSESQMATTVVSLNIEPPSGRSYVTKQGEATTIYDSERLPVVKLHNAAAVTTTTMIEESSGRAVSSGGVSQQYRHGSHDISAEMGRLDDLMGHERVNLAEDGTEEAAQVSLFLEQEHEVMKKVFESATPQLEIAVH